MNSKKIDFLLNYQKIADIHATRLNNAILKTAKLFPLAKELLIFWNKLKEYLLSL